MEKFHLYTLILHVAGGTVAFITAPIAMIVRKGAKAHRFWGKAYFWAMTAVVISGIALSVMLSNIFLFCVAFFSYYLVVSGYRWLYRKRNDAKVAKLDWFIHITAAFFNAALIVIGVLRLMQSSHDSFGYISIVFGAIGLNFCRININQFLNPKPKSAWLFNHFGGMIGGYIATVSAFSAVNMNFLPTILQWLWPTIIGVPVIYLFIAFYKRKIAGGKKVEELVQVR